ncbi:MAG: hypothetical protein DSY42_02310 [Aquifex sp.]|nr:MAG: hypothetical protein DSY42_02310 [Aquifex sp.]
MDIKRVNVELIKKKFEELSNKSEEEKEKRKEIQLLLRLVYPLIADTKGKEVLELYTKLKEKDTNSLKETEEFLEKIVKSL